MVCSISSIYYCPVKSLSFLNSKKIINKKKLGILDDRIFAFTRNIDFEKSKLIEKYPKERKLNNFLTLKNTPVLNKYQFIYKNNDLTLFKDNKIIISIPSNDSDKYKFVCDKLIQLEKSLSNPIFLLKNELYPFFDTTHSSTISNTISLININSINDLKNKIGQSIEFERFRGNLYVDGIYPWEERNWINKTIKINNTLFKVQKHISRCSATNLQPNTDNVTINLPMTLKKYYDHFDLGVYLTAIEDGEINIGDPILLNK